MNDDGEISSIRGELLATSYRLPREPKRGAFIPKTVYEMRAFPFVVLPAAGPTELFMADDRPIRRRHRRATGECLT